MLVKEIMTAHPVFIEPEMSVTDAQRIMKENGVRHLPVLREGKEMIGLITRDSLNRVRPSDLTSLSIWEINYQLSRIKAKDVMVREVITVGEEVTVEEAARTMIGNQVGSLPVLRGNRMVGIVTDNDLLRALTNLMGWREPGVRVTVEVPDEPGWLAKYSSAIAQAGGLIVGGGSYPAGEPLLYRMVFKVRYVPLDTLKGVCEGVPGGHLVDIRDMSDMSSA